MVRLGTPAVMVGALWKITSFLSIAVAQDDEVCDGRDCDPGQSALVQMLSGKQRLSLANKDVVKDCDPTYEDCAQFLEVGGREATAPTLDETVDCFSSSTKFDFYDAGEPIWNNLAGNGPGVNNLGNHPEQLRWNQIGWARGEPFDLVVEVVGDYVANDINQNGLNGKFGQVNVKSGTQVTLKVSFVDPAKGDAPVTLERFEWTFFDLDHSLFKNGNPKAQETIKVCDFVGRAAHEEHSFIEWSDSDGCSYFRSGEDGSGCDKPVDPMKLGWIPCSQSGDDDRTINQLYQAVALSFENTASFEVTLQAGFGGGGRNFFFSGHSGLEDIIPCPSITKPPRPTTPCELCCDLTNIFGTDTWCGDYSGSMADCNSKFIHKSDSFNKRCAYDIGSGKCTSGPQFECKLEQECGGDPTPTLPPTEESCDQFCDKISIDGTTGQQRCAAFNSDPVECDQRFVRKSDKFNKLCSYDASRKKCTTGPQLTCVNLEETCGIAPPPPTPPPGGSCDDFCSLVNLKDEGKTCSQFNGKETECRKHYEGDADGRNFKRCQFNADTSECYAEEGGVADCSDSDCFEPPTAGCCARSNMVCPRGCIVSECSPLVKNQLAVNGFGAQCLSDPNTGNMEWSCQCIMAGVSKDKKGLLSTKGIPGAAWSHFRGSVSWLYNYNADFLNDEELAFIKAEQIEFIPMFNGAYMQTERVTSVKGWPRPSGKDRRCFFWESAKPPNPNNPNYGSSTCTAEDIVQVLQATNQMLDMPIKRLMLWNEPWDKQEGANGIAQDATETAKWFKAVLEPALTTLGGEVKLISATSKHNDIGLGWDSEFLRACRDIECNLELIAEFAVHRYNIKYGYWDTHYSRPSGTFYTERVAEFAEGYGGWDGEQWKQFFESRHIMVTEHSAEGEKKTAYGVPDNKGTCLRMTGQFGNESCDGAACEWGEGSLKWLLTNEAITGIALWPTFHDGKANFDGGRASQMVDVDGSLTPVGRAFLGMPDGGAAVDCSDELPADAGEWRATPTCSIHQQCPFRQGNT